MIESHCLAALASSYLFVDLLIYKIIFLAYKPVVSNIATLQGVTNFWTNSIRGSQSLKFWQLLTEGTGLHVCLY